MEAIFTDYWRWASRRPCWRTTNWRRGCAAGIQQAAIPRRRRAVDSLYHDGGQLMDSKSRGFLACCINPDAQPRLISAVHQERSAFLRLDLGRGVTGTDSYIGYGGAISVQHGDLRRIRWHHYAVRTPEFVAKRPVAGIVVNLPMPGSSL